MLADKKGEGLSFTVIIIAIIALVVLVVILVIFSQKSGSSVNTLDSCAARGGECKSGSCDSGFFKIPDGECPTKTDICCIKIPGT